MDDLNHI